MNHSVHVNNSGSIGIFGLLGVLFIGLKLTGYIEWDWVWVVSPFWIPLVIGLGVVVIGIVIALIASLIDVIIDAIP